MRWRTVEEYPTYEVSDSGQVRNGSTGQMRKAFRAKRGGYPTVTLWADGRHLTRTVHGLVARAFIGPRPEGQQVRHLNGDASDPRLENLAYGTPTQNQEDSVQHGTHAMTNRTHCPEGHEYSAENTAYTTKGGRLCRECQRRHKREWARRNRIAQAV